jgi:rubrerythrin
MDTPSGKVIETLKQAIIMEKQGNAFYAKVASEAEDEGVKSIFTTMAEEEKRHTDFLSRHYSEYVKNGSFATGITYGNPEEISEKILNDDVKHAIEAAGFEAAAISAAIDMEKKSIDLYGTRARQAENRAEEEFYGMLAKWETTHLDLLVDLNNAIVESVWNENSFWPF